MATVKYQLIQEIEGIDYENLLKEILILLQDINGLKKYIHLTPEQKTQIESASMNGSFYPITISIPKKSRKFN